MSRRRIFLAVCIILGVVLLITSCVFFYHRERAKRHFQERDDVHFTCYARNSKGSIHALGFQNAEVTTKDVEVIRAISSFPFPFYSPEFLSFDDSVIKSDVSFRPMPLLKGLDIIGSAKIASFPQDSLLHLLKSPRLQYLTLIRVDIASDFWEKTGVLSLKDIWLDKVNITDEQLLDHFSFHQCEHVRLVAIPVTEKLAERLAAEAAQLEVLVVSDNQISDEFLKPLSSMKTLDWLDLSKTKITDNGLSHIPPSIHFLNLSHTEISDLGISHLPPSIENLKLVGTNITNHSLQNIPPTVQELDISETQITNLAGLNSKKQLKILTAEGLQLTEDALAILPSSLECLCLKNTTISDAGLEKIGDLSFEKSLTIIGCAQNSPDMIAKLKEKGIQFKD